jgi:hypothetical protein
MSEQEAAQVDEAPDAATAGAPSEEAGLANAVDDRAAQLTGASGATETDAPVASNAGAVAAAEEHLDDVDLNADREALKKLQKRM